MSLVTIEQLWIYPVKSLTGIPLHSATLLSSGLEGDREWMLVDADGLFLSQRKLPRMATIRTELRDGELVLSRPGDGEVLVPTPEGDPCTVKVWNSICSAYVASDHVNEWLQQALAITSTIRLVRFDKRVPRPTNPDRFGPYHTYFSDGAPYLSANLASLQALNQHLILAHTIPVDIQRFRPNLVFSGMPAFAEHEFQYLRAAGGEAILGLKDHSQRCSIITVDQNTGIASATQHPFAELAQLNSMPGKPKAPAFGVNTVLLSGDGSPIRCGDQWQAV
jgi:uncharacterized protein YcbX